jgi:alpha/beta superfamily hydrolase
MQKSILPSSFFIKGPVGNLETIIEPPSVSPKKIIGIICHPHPLYEGTMHNKVVTTLVRAFQKLGVTAIRFNFRGVGKSEGAYAEGIGEAEDLFAVVNWVKNQYPDNQIWLAGFSFGSYIAACVATKIHPQQLILIAPPVHHFGFVDLPEMHYPCMVVQGEEDEVVPPQKVYAWVNSLRNPPQLFKLPNVGHFFHGHLITLRELLVKELSFKSKNL